MQHDYSNKNHSSLKKISKFEYEISERIEDFLCLCNSFELEVNEKVVKRIVDFACSYDCVCGKKDYEFFKN
jgi:hypothetical protein